MPSDAKTPLPARAAGEPAIVPHFPTPPTILVVDDDAALRRAVRRLLEALGATVYDAITGCDALRVAPAIAAAHGPDLVVLDVELPDMDGAAVCRALRAWTDVPILVISGRSSESDTVRLLDAGADDYLTKPFGAGEFAARVRARLRAARARAARPEVGPRAQVHLGDLVLDVDGRVATRDGRDVRLTRTEWEILRTLTAHAGRTLTHQEIFDAVWDQPFGDAVKSVRVHVTNLRRKVERVPSTPSLIVTVRRDGYRLDMPSP